MQALTLNKATSDYLTITHRRDLSADDVTIPPDPFDPTTVPCSFLRLKATMP